MKYFWRWKKPDGSSKAKSLGRKNDDHPNRQTSADSSNHAVGKPEVLKKKPVHEAETSMGEFVNLPCGVTLSMKRSRLLQSTISG
jgi:hypothetical protein